MKIALVIESFCPCRGGGETYTVNLAKYLVKEGHEVHIFTNVWEEKYSNMHFHKVPVLNILGILSFALNSAREVKKYNFDVVQGLGESYWVDVSRQGGGCEKFFIFKVPYLTEKNYFCGFFKKLARISRMHNIMHLFIEKKLFSGQKCKRIIVPSEMIKKQIKSFYKISDEKFVVIRNGVDLQRFHPYNKKKFRDEIRRRYNIKEEEVVILFVSHDFRRKGLHFLLRALVQIKDKDGFKLLIVGRDKISRYKKIVEKYGLKKNIIFTGQSRETEKYYASADFFVLPTLYDPFANVTLEALASGLPVITTRYNGASEIITDGKEGFIIDDPRDITIFAEKINYLAVNKEQREQFSLDARALAENFSLIRNHQEVLKVYTDIVHTVIR